MYGFYIYNINIFVVWEDSLPNIKTITILGDMGLIFFKGLCLFVRNC